MKTPTPTLVLLLSLVVYSSALAWAQTALPQNPTNLVQETNVVSASIGLRPEETNSHLALQALLQIQEQIRSNHLAVEQAGKEAAAAAARNAETFSNGLQTIEDALAAQQRAFSTQSAQELETLQKSNRVTLMVGGTFTVIASVAILIIAWFQWRMSKAWAGIATALASGRGPGDSTVAEVSGEEPPPALADPDSASSTGLLGAMAQLEHRIDQLEHSPHLAATPNGSAAGSAGGNGGSAETSGNGQQGNGSAALDNPEEARISSLLSEGKALLKDNRLEAALACFDELLTLNPNHGEALVKKGAALERLQKLTEASECYDRAIAADGSMALAYLHKGGLYNRLERFKEALECYEMALRAHDERPR